MNQAISDPFQAICIELKDVISRSKDNDLV